MSKLGFLLFALLASPAWAGRVFNGTSDCGQTAATLTLGSTGQITIALSAINTFADNDKLWAESTTNYNFTAGAVLVDPNSGSHPGTLEMAENDGASSFWRVDSTRPVNPGTAFGMYAFTLVNAVSPGMQFYTDGVNTSTGGVAGGPNQVFTDQTWYFMSRACSALRNNGTLNWFVLWTTALSPLEVQSASAGVYPTIVHGSNIKLFTLFGFASPEIDQSGNGNSITITGTTIGNGGGFGTPYSLPETNAY